MGVETVTLALDGQPIVLDSTGRASVQLSDPGVFVATATATDAAGNIRQLSDDLFVQDPNDPDAPIAEITTPADEDRITSPVDVIGTVDDANLAFFTLSVAPFGSGDFVEFASGTAPVDRRGTRKI